MTGLAILLLLGMIFGILFFFFIGVSLLVDRFG